MITNKEMQYVDFWANRIPMPGIEYSIQVLNSIKKCLETWKEKYSDKDYNIIFSNGEEINFKIFDYNLCHMFGIDYKNIKGEYFDECRKNIFGYNASDFNSYELLNMIIENIEKIAESDNDINNKAKFINYYKSAIKCEIFNKFNDFEKFNYAVINSDEEDIEDKKLLFVPSNEPICPYFSMGLIKTTYKENNMDNENPYYAINTLLAMSDPKKFFDNKEVIIPTQMIILDDKNLKKVSASALEKIRLLTMYKSIVEKYKIDCSINIYSDYETILNDISNELVLK